MLKLSKGFSKILPVIGFILFFGTALYLLSLSLKTLPLGVVYATWAGLGTLLTVLIGVVLFKDKINRRGYIGIIVLLVGLVLINM